jgi:DNA repair protein RecN (Recombination protein N)
MAGASLEVTLVGQPEPGPIGAERAEFVFAAGAAQEPMPLGRVASGGELSRTMLACRSVLANLDDIPTLVFDEVDAGIGGRAAAAVGRRLAVLAAQRQVVVVTHLAQIAARADRHFVVAKRAGKATVEVVDGPEREAELARMLSGTVGDVSLAHARQLLDPERSAAGVGSGRPALSRATGWGRASGPIGRAGRAAAVSLALALAAVSLVVLIAHGPGRPHAASADRSGRDPPKATEQVRRRGAA